jgi:von Willebrand factor
MRIFSLLIHEYLLYKFHYLLTIIDFSLEQFDFTGNRNLTGIITKGGEYGWVKSFMIQYSKDNVIWNKLLDDYGKPREFLANYDSETEKRNLFKTPINAQFLKIQPLKWHSAIELKIEPLGCFLPYRE